MTRHGVKSERGRVATAFGRVGMGKDKGRSDKRATRDVRSVYGWIRIYAVPQVQIQR